MVKTSTSSKKRTGQSKKAVSLKMEDQPPTPHRSFLAVGVVILAAILLVVLLFLRPEGVGKAIQSTTTAHTLQLQVSGTALQAVLDAPEAVQGLSLEITADGLCGRYLSFTTPLATWDYVYGNCVGDTFTFSAASATETFIGIESIVSADLSAVPAPWRITLHDASVYVGGTNVFDSASTDTFTVTQLAAAQAPAVSSEQDSPRSSEDNNEGGGGGGGGLTCKRIWNCSDWGSCTNGQQDRICQDLNNCTSVKKFGFKEYPVYQLGPEKPAEQQACTGSASVPTSVSSGSGSVSSTYPASATTVPRSSTVSREEQPASSSLSGLYWVVVVVSLLAGVAVGVLSWYHHRKIKEEDQEQEHLNKSKQILPLMGGNKK